MQNALIFQKVEALHWLSVSFLSISLSMTALYMSAYHSGEEVVLVWDIFWKIRKKIKVKKQWSISFSTGVKNPMRLENLLLKYHVWWDHSNCWKLENYWVFFRSLVFIFTWLFAHSIIYMLSQTIVYSDIKTRLEHCLLMYLWRVSRPGSNGCCNTPFLWRCQPQRLWVR